MSDPSLEAATAEEWIAESQDAREIYDAHMADGLSKNDAMHEMEITLKVFRLADKGPDGPRAQEINALFAGSRVFRNTRCVFVPGTDVVGHIGPKDPAA